MMNSRALKGQFGRSLLQALAVLSLGVLVPAPAKAEIQNDAVGFSTNHVFESSEAGEHIDTMTGNMTLTIPIGPRYKLGDRIDYGLTLYYNSKIWQHDCPEPSTDPLELCPGELAAPKTYGVGWNMWPARVYHKNNDYLYIYRLVLEDGSEHLFCDGGTQNACANERTLDIAPIVVRKLTSGPTFLGWEAFPGDGRRIVLGKVLNASTQEAIVSRIESVELKSDNTPAHWVNFQYNSQTLRMTSIEDSQGRLISGDWDQYSRRYAITFPAFPTSGGSESPVISASATYTLQYEEIHFRDPSDSVTTDHADNFLTRIEYPAPLDAETESYRFEYARDGFPKTYGWMTQKTSPTGAISDYYYHVYRTSVRRPHHTELYLKTLSADGKLYRWSWSRFQDALIREVDPTPENPAGVESFSGSNPHFVRALDPFDNLTTYRFGVTFYNHAEGGNCTNTECPNNWDDGLLLEVASYAGPQPDGNRLVRRMTYEWEPGPGSGGSPLMLQYKAPKGPYNNIHSPATTSSLAVRTRQIKEHTYTPPTTSSSGQMATVESDDFVNGRPKIRREYIDGVLYRTTYTDRVNHGAQEDPRTYAPDDHKFVEVRNASEAISRTERCFDPSGRLAWEVRRAGSATAVPTSTCSTDEPTAEPNDVVIKHSYNSTSAQRESTEIEGGDDGSVPSRVEHFAHTAGGYLKSKRYGDRTWKVIDRSVDRNSGLTFETRDPSGIPTRYEWDVLGRLTKIIPRDPEKPTTISYPSLLEARVHQELSATNFVRTIYHYDQLGRLVKTLRRNIDGVYDVQHVEYDAAGRVLRRSEWALESAPAADLKWTKYDYSATVQPVEPIPGYPTTFPDPLGRIHGVTTPDDPTPETPTTETKYFGNTTVVTVRDIRGFVGGIESTLTSTTTYTKDGLGRLVAVDSPGTGADAEYDYDELDNLVEVRLTDPTTPSYVQIRRFEYDTLSRLRLAANPENGTTLYTKYDARGNLRQYTESRGFTFTMDYDDLDRLKTKHQSAGGSDLLLAENFYDAGTGFNAGAATGRLVEQKSYEILDAQSTLLSDVRFGYGLVSSSGACTLGARGYNGLNGRSAWQSSVISGWGVEAKTEFCQDELGMPYLIAYPDTASSGRTRSKVAFSYQNGYLWEMHDYARGAPLLLNTNYAPGGIPVELTRGNALRNQVELDERARPSKFKLLGYENQFERPSLENVGNCAGPWASRPDNLVIGHCEPDPELVGTPTILWDSGLYNYDMAGNITSIGTTQQYFYDELSRLTRAVIVAPNTVIHDQEYFFDAFGNMKIHKDTLSTLSTPKTRNFTVNWATNRLTTQVKTGYGTTQVLTYTFDATGNMTREGGVGYNFDGQGRLREVMDPERGRIGNYHYDASGYRVRAEAEGGDTFYLRDASGQVLSEFRRRAGIEGAVPAWNKDYIYAFGKSFALVQNDIPKAPKRPWAANVTSSGLDVQWFPQGEPDLLGYSLERRFKPDSTTAESITTIDLGGTAVGWHDTFAAGAGATVRYTLTAMDSAGNLSDASPELLVRPHPSTPPPTAPQALSLAPGDRAVMLSWTVPGVPSEELWGHIVERSNAQSGPFVRLNDTILAEPEFLDSGLSNGQTYWYQVRSIDTANRQSGALGPDDATPSDLSPPGRITGIRAAAERAAGLVKVTWKRSTESDIDYYKIFRSTDPGTLGSPTSTPTVDASPYPEEFSLSDPAPQGTTYYYTVEAVDNAGNVSEPSVQASARPRRTDMTAPTLQTPQLTFETFGVTSTDGTSAGNVDFGNVHDEDDDIVKFVLTWSSGSGATSGYAIYRKAADEDEFKFIDTTPAGTTTFGDATINKGDYTYYVVGRKLVSGSMEESAGSPAASGHTDRAYAPFPTNSKVRNLCMTDSREEYATMNRESRVVYVTWSRVTEPDLRGYNLYRTCSWSGCRGDGYSMDTFACESVWTRVNSTLIPPDTREFADSSVGGLMGCFDYAVRPVGPNFAEGPIAKVVQANLTPGLPLGNGQARQCTAAQSFIQDVPARTPITIQAWLEPPNGINGQVRGTGDALGPPAAPTTVNHSIEEKPALLNQHRRTMYARVSWTMPSPLSAIPVDLKGFHVEMAGSPQGPWKRVTKNPVAWWERHYTVQSLDTQLEDWFWGNSYCSSFRVLTVDEDGNESARVEATSTNPSSSACPMTPNAPVNLRASTSNSPHAIRLDWDDNQNVAEYIVYRLPIKVSNNHFYPTVRLPGTARSYHQTDEDVSAPGVANADTECPYSYVTMTGEVVHTCQVNGLDAYYVTARYQNGGESPRSNLVLWEWGADPGYARSLPPQGETFEAVASDRRISADSLACWDVRSDTGHPTMRSDPSVARELETRLAEWTGPSPNGPALAVAPMRSLGVVDDPPWVILDLHTDHLGTVRVITDSYGVVVSRHDYYPWGEQIVKSPPGFNTHELTGHERDAESGLDYMLARYYESAVGRFLSVDPEARSVSKAHPQSWNRYSYGANNPVRYLDPDGKHNAEGHIAITTVALGGAMSEQAVGEVVDGNLAVDDDQGTTAESANKHGMSGTDEKGKYQTPEAAAEGTATVVGEKVEEAVQRVLAGDVKGARSAFGAATHAVQDQSADSHQGARWEGTVGTALKSPITGVKHAINDQILTTREAKAGVAATQSLHGTLTSRVQSEGKARGLTDAVVAGAMKAFNGK